LRPQTTPTFYLAADKDGLPSSPPPIISSQFLPLTATFYFYWFFCLYPVRFVFSFRGLHLLKIRQALCFWRLPTATNISVFFNISSLFSPKDHLLYAHDTALTSASGSTVSWSRIALLVKAYSSQLFIVKDHISQRLRKRQSRARISSAKCAVTATHP
jgi:hypothetical protein